MAYDDEETLKIKSDYAMDKCLSGITVWAISQDTKDAKYSGALRIIASRPSKRAMQDGTASALSTNAQYKWTNC